MSSLLIKLILSYKILTGLEINSLGVVANICYHAWNPVANGISGSKNPTACDYGICTV